MPSGRTNRRALIAGLGEAFVSLLTLAASVVHAGAAEGVASRAWRIDTEHLFGFVIGTDVGEVGDKEMEAEVTGGFGKRPGSYAALAPSLEYEFVPIQNLRLAPTVFSSYHTISGVAGLDDRRQLGFDGFSFDARYRIIDRSRWGRGSEPVYHGYEVQMFSCMKCDAEITRSADRMGKPHPSAVLIELETPSISYFGNNAKLFFKESVASRRLQPRLGTAR